MALIDTLSDAQKDALKRLKDGLILPGRLKASLKVLLRRGFIVEDDFAYPPNSYSLTSVGVALFEEQLCHANLASDFTVDDRVERSWWHGGSAEPYTHEWKPGTVVGIGKARLTIKYDDGTMGRAEAYHVRKVAKQVPEFTFVKGNVPVWLDPDRKLKHVKQHNVENALCGFESIGFPADFKVDEFEANEETSGYKPCPTCLKLWREMMGANDPLSRGDQVEVLEGSPYNDLVGKHGTVDYIGKSDYFGVRVDGMYCPDLRRSHLRKLPSDSALNVDSLADQATNACTHTDDGSVCVMCMGESVVSKDDATLAEIHAGFAKLKAIDEQVQGWRDLAAALDARKQSMSVGASKSTDDLLVKDAPTRLDMFKAGQRVRVTDTCPSPEVCGSTGTIVAVQSKYRHPIDVQLDGHDGVDHFLPHEIEVVDASSYTYTAIGEGEQRLIVARHADGDVVVIRMDSSTRFVATSVKGNYDHEREVNEWFVAQMHPHMAEGDEVVTSMVEDHAPMIPIDDEGFREHMVASWAAIADALDLDSNAMTTTLVVDTIIDLKRELDAERKAHAEAEAFAQQEHASYNELWEAVRKAYCDVFELQMWNATALQAVDLLARAAKEGKTLHNAVRSAHGEVYDGAWQEGQSDVDVVQMLARSAQGHKTRAIEQAEAEAKLANELFEHAKAALKKTEADAAIYRQALIEAQESLNLEGVRSESIGALLAQSRAGADLLDALFELRRDNSELRQNISNLNTVIEAINTRLVDERQRYAIPYKCIDAALGNPNDLLAEVTRLRRLETDAVALRRVSRLLIDRSRSDTALYHRVLIEDVEALEDILATAGADLLSELTTEKPESEEAK